MTSRRRTSRRIRANNAATAIDPRSAVIYFDLHLEDYNVEEDARDGKRLAKRMMSDGGKTVNEMERKALDKLSKLFKVRIFNEGHGSTDDLICGINVDSWADVNHILKILSKQHVGGDDEIDTGVRYFVARGFTLFPRGVNGPRFSDTLPTSGLTEWVEEHKP